MTLYLRYAARSDIGMVRKANEDSGFAGRTLLAVADGMGGHAAGELASSTAIATLAELDSQELATADLVTSLDEAVLTSAERIGQYIEADRSRSGMGTTLTAILWQSGRIGVIHVGDSRAYLLRGGELAQITRDHTYVQSLIDAGQISAEEARRHPKRNLLLRAIDGNGLPEGEASVREAQAGDRYLLCSDGLSGVVTDAAIGDVLRQMSDPTAAVSALVDLALEGGAPDNVTAVVADVVDAEDAEVARELELSSPVVVGAAGERRNREALPGLHFPDDVEPDDVPGAEATAAVTDWAPESIQSSAPAEGTESLVPRRPSFLRRHLLGLSALGVLLLALLAGTLGFSWWLGSQWYVGVQGGYVTVFQGVPQTLVGSPLSRVASQTALEVADLPKYNQAQVLQTIEAATEADADRIVEELAAKAANCSVDPAPLGCPRSLDPRSGSSL
jgi:PPM family protein phosphatase